MAYKNPTYLLSSSSEEPSADLWFPIYLQTKPLSCRPCFVHNSWSLLCRQWFRRPQAVRTDSGLLGFKCISQKLGKKEILRMAVIFCDVSWAQMTGGRKDSTQSFSW